MDNLADAQERIAYRLREVPIYAVLGRQVRRKSLTRKGLGTREANKLALP